MRTVRVVGPTPRPLFITHEAIEFEVSNIKVDDAPAPKPAEEGANGVAATAVVSTTPAPAPAPTPAPTPAAPLIPEATSLSGKR